MERIVHLHIPKTAGTALRESLASTKEMVIQQITSHGQDAKEESGFVSGHFSFNEAKNYGNNIITVMRDPIDRFISIYYFLKSLHRNNVEKTEKTKIASNLNIIDFAKSFDSMELISELYNHVTWQLHSDYRLFSRGHHISSEGFTYKKLINDTIENLKGFSVVGFQDQYSVFVENVNEKFGLSVPVKKINATDERKDVAELSEEERVAILRWVEADMELYNRARDIFGH